MTEAINESSFQIALVNHRPSEKHSFDWLGFSPAAVTKPQDLPYYLVFGAIDEEAFRLTDEGWSAAWANPQTKSRILLTWNRKTERYTVSQTWHGVEGSVSDAPADTPLNDVLAGLYIKSFPPAWEEEAKVHFEKQYQTSWIKTPSDLSLYFGVPDGVFYTIVLPVMVKNIRNAKKILEDLDRISPIDYGFFATACLLDQRVYYEIGRAPEWTSDVAQVLTQSLGETGLLPLEIPKYEEENGIRSIRLDRSVMALCISVPFGQLEDMLARLAESPIPVLTKAEPPHRRETLPIIVPVNIGEDARALRIEDEDQGIETIYQFLPMKPLGELLSLDCESQIDELEKMSDSMIQQIMEATAAAEGGEG